MSNAGKTIRNKIIPLLGMMTHVHICKLMYIYIYYTYKFTLTNVNKYFIFFTMVFFNIKLPFILRIIFHF